MCTARRVAFSTPPHWPSHATQVRNLRHGRLGVCATPRHARPIPGQLAQTVATLAAGITPQKAHYAFVSERFGGFLQRWLVTTVGVLIADFLLPGISYDVPSSLFLASLLLGLLNAFVRPVLVLFSLPFVLLTLGLGLLVINAVLLLIVGSVVSGFRVNGFGSALLGALIISVTSFVANVFLGRGPTVRRVKATSDPKSGNGPVIDV